MLKRCAPCLVLGLWLLACTPAAASEPISIFFLHNSVGDGLIEQGAMREHLAEFNARSAQQGRLWDHHYPYIGLRDPAGNDLGYPYSVLCGQNNNPDGLRELWLNSSEPYYVLARDSILNNHDVIAFKSCYRAGDFGGAQTASELDAALAQYKAWYLEMRGVFDAHPHHTFVVLTPPPRHRLHDDASPLRAAATRAFADWLRSEDFLGQPPRANVRTFDLFDLLAAPDDGSPAANMLRYEYERSHGDGDSHPNELANATLGPLLMQALVDAAGQTATAVPPVPDVPIALAVYPNPSNPLATIQFDLPQDLPVTLEILDLQGRRVQLLATADLAGGRHRFGWDGRDMFGRPAGSGVFLCRLRAGAAVTVQRLTVIK